MKKNALKRTLALLFALLLVLAISFSGLCYADSPTDEIRNYWITANVNEDGTVNLDYYIEWEVLESDGIGPLSWVNIGMPNSEYLSYVAKSGNIRKIESDGNYINVYFDKDYYEGETVCFEFEVRQDYLYEMNALEDGYTRYSFTPGWFNGITVDDLEIYWNDEKAENWEPSGLVNDGFIEWQTKLAPGETYTVNVTYPNDAFKFDSSKYVAGGYDYSGYSGDDYSSDDGGDIILGFIVFVVFFLYLPFRILSRIARAARAAYYNSVGFKPATVKKVTRTRVEYYPTCQGCGAPREDGQRKCPFCGRSFVKSEEVIEEEQEKAKEEDREAFKYKKDGEYHYSSDPNTFVRVHVVNVPAPRPAAPSGGPRGGSGPRVGGGGGRGGSGHHTSGGGGRGGSSHSSCAHSSCACACASCACACACACAGGGRAGCTTKDFYKTDLKLSQLKVRLKKRIRP